MEDSDDELDDRAFEQHLQRHSRRSTNGKLRGAVAAENCQPQANWTPTVHPKTLDQKARIRDAISRSIHFAALSSDDLEQVVDAFFGPLQTEGGTEVIREGEFVMSGEPAFFVLESGTLDVFKRQNGCSHPGVKVFAYEAGGTFGDLALMHNSARFATVIATSKSTLWSIDRDTFNHCVKGAAKRQRFRHTKFLESVELLRGLTPQDRAQIADVLTTRMYQKGEPIIQKGEQGTEMFFVEDGSAYAVLDGRQVKEYGIADYFGELALLQKQPRAVDVIAGTSPTKVACLDGDSFRRLLGNLSELMSERTGEYSRAVASDVKSVGWSVPYGAGIPAETLKGARQLLEEEEACDCVRLRIVAVHGLDMRSGGVARALNPYVVARFGFTEQRTAASRNVDEAATWEDDHELVFPIASGAEALEMEVMHDESVFESISLGRGDVATWGMAINKWTRQRIRLAGSIGSAASAVEVEFEVLLDIVPDQGVGGQDEEDHEREARALCVEKLEDALASGHLEKIIQQGQQQSSLLQQPPLLRQLRAELASAEAELAMKEAELQARREAHMQRSQNGTLAASARAGEVGGIEADVAQPQRVRELQDQLEQRQAYALKLERTLKAREEGLADSSAERAGDGDMHSALGLGEDSSFCTMVAVWQGRIAALNDELKQKIERTTALRSREQALEATLRSQSHKDETLIGSLTTATNELREVFARAKGGPSSTPQFLALGGAQANVVSITPSAATIAKVAPPQGWTQLGAATAGDGVDSAAMPRLRPLGQRMSPPVPSAPLADAPSSASTSSSRQPSKTLLPSSAIHTRPSPCDSAERHLESSCTQLVAVQSTGLPSATALAPSVVAAVAAAAACAQQGSPRSAASGVCGNDYVLPNTRAGAGGSGNVAVAPTAGPPLVACATMPTAAIGPVMQVPPPGTPTASPAYVRTHSPATSAVCVGGAATPSPRGSVCSASAPSALATPAAAPVAARRTGGAVTPSPGGSICSGSSLRAPAPTTAMPLGAAIATASPARRPSTGTLPAPPPPSTPGRATPTLPPPSTPGKAPPQPSRPSTPPRTPPAPQPPLTPGRTMAAGFATPPQQAQLGFAVPLVATSPRAMTPLSRSPRQAVSGSPFNSIVAPVLQSSVQVPLRSPVQLPGAAAIVGSAQARPGSAPVLLHAPQLVVGNALVPSGTMTPPRQGSSRMLGHMPSMPRTPTPPPGLDRRHRIAPAA